MAEPFLGEVKLMAFNFPPKGWALCDGQLLPINQNQALFSLLGTTFGGDGRVTFALPDLRGRVAMHDGNGHTLGERGGEAAHTLNVDELPPHGHALRADADLANLQQPSGALPAARGRGGVLMYAPDTSPGAAPMAPGAVASAGGSQPHPNLQPYLAMNFVIALQGIFPSRS